VISGKPLFSVAQIQQKVVELAAIISKDFAGKDLLVVPILKGAFMFASDLVRHVQVPLTMDFVLASSYVKMSTGGPMDSSGEVKLHLDVHEDVRNRDVLLVEDIIDTGVTLNFLREHLLEKGARSLKICGLLDKRGRRIVDVPIDYIGFDIPNEYVVGYGLDYDNKFRNLPYIAVFKKKE
jgi:hypoxanthine phosphoribosyltransferase